MYEWLAGIGIGTDVRDVREKENGIELFRSGFSDGILFYLLHF